MRKHLWWLTTALCVILSGSLEAGELYQPTKGLSFGFQGGLALTSFGSDNVGWNSTAGPVFGAYATYSFGPIVAVQGGVLFASKGAEMSDLPTKINLHYCQFVGMIRINPPMSKHETKKDLLPKILFGLSEGVKVSDDVDTGDPPRFAKGTDPSIMFGGGFDVPVDARWRVTFDLLFDFSFNSFTRYQELKNNAVHFMLGLAF